MDALFLQFQQLPIDKSLISLEPGSIEGPILLLPGQRRPHRV